MTVNFARICATWLFVTLVGVGKDRGWITEAGVLKAEHLVSKIRLFSLRHPITAEL